MSPLYLQVMFEHYQFSGLYVAIQAVLTLYAQGEVFTRHDMGQNVVGIFTKLFVFVCISQI